MPDVPQSAPPPVSSLEAPDSDAPAEPPAASDESPNENEGPAARERGSAKAAMTNDDAKSASAGAPVTGERLVATPTPATEDHRHSSAPPPVAEFDALAFLPPPALPPRLDDPETQVAPVDSTPSAPAGPGSIDVPAAASPGSSRSTNAIGPSKPPSIASISYEALSEPTRSQRTRTTTEGGLPVVVPEDHVPVQKLDSPSATSYAQSLPPAAIEGELSGVVGSSAESSAATRISSVTSSVGEPESLTPPLDEFDSAPPSIPSAAAVVTAEALPGALGQVGSQAFPGDVIADRYEVQGVLGEGGMGIVYKCTDLVSDELVAVKRVIVPDADHASEYIMWFYKEARALAALHHPSIVGARDFGQLQDGSPYLAMDLAAGQSLHDLSHAGLAWPVIWHIVDQTLGALAHAHARDIIHGDLKPSNVLVEEIPGQPPLVHLLDFGLAWLKGDPHDERLDGEKAMEFKPHAGAGTPGYMAPEQIQHEQHHVCGATDIYSLGCILYKLLSRKAPFGGASKELLKQHAFSEVPALEEVIELPKGVTDFVLRMLRKRPWDRWLFAAEARRDWAKFRPGDVNPQDFKLPRIRKSVRPRELTGQQGRRGRNPALSAVPERAPGLLSIRQSPLVGRKDLRQTLREVCDEVIDGEGPPHRLVILVGPAGSGKSRAAEWLCCAVHEEGTMIPLRARYRPVRSPDDGMLGAVTRYYNFEQATRDTIERSLLQRWKVRRSDKNGRAWVAGAGEWLRPTPPGVEAPLGPSGIRFALDTVATRRAVSRYVVKKIAAGRPLLFWLDDLHHASESTFEGFLKMHAEDTEQRYVIIATVRAEDVHLGTPAAERLRHLREKMDGVAIDVTPLEPETTQELIRRSLPLEDDAVYEAAKRSRGNPLFALQQLHAWALAGNMQLVEGVYRVPPEVLAVRPKTTAELWDSRINALPEQHRLAAYATSTLSSDLRREVLHPLLTELGLPADAAIRSLQNAEIIIPRGPDRYSWPHALLQEHLFAELAERDDREHIYRAAARALERHPLAGSRRIVRQRVLNLLNAGDAETAAHALFAYLQNSWNGAREPLATLTDLDLLRGRLQGKTRAIQDRWRAEALRHVGRANEAREYAERARRVFENAADGRELAHCLRALGHIASELGHSQEGRELAFRALELFRGLRDTLGQAQCEAVLGEIDYLLGEFETARQFMTRGERHFASIDQPLGRGQCLLLLSWVEHSEGAVERSRRLALEARSEFERIGYRLGTAQANASLAHVEHRMMNLRNAEVGAQDALIAFESLRTPRGQAACRRLLAMIGIDSDDADMAALHADWSQRLYSDLDDPWGVLESKVLSAQLALMERRFDDAEKLLAECATIDVQEPEPRQHQLLTQSWLAMERGTAREAEELLWAAMEVFPEARRVGDHTPHLLSRMSRLAFGEEARERLDRWRAQLRHPSGTTDRL